MYDSWAMSCERTQRMFTGALTTWNPERVLGRAQPRGATLQREAPVMGGRLRQDFHRIVPLCARPSASASLVTPATRFPSNRLSAIEHYAIVLSAILILRENASRQGNHPLCKAMMEQSWYSRQVWE